MGNANFADKPDTTITLTDSDIDEAVAKYPFIVVDCWAQWCGPCKMLGPILENLAKKYAGEIVFGKIDVDANAETARKYGVRSIPNLIVFKNGQKVGDIVGAMPETKLMERINALKG